MKNSYHITQQTNPDDSAESDRISESQIIEALLFSSQQSLTIQQISKVTGIKHSKKIRKLLEELNHFYRENERAFHIQQVADGYQLRTETRFQKWIKKGRIVKPVQLSQSVMETLSIIAYQQPVTRAEIEDIRTVDATYALRTLLNKKLIRILGRKEIMGRPLLYGSSKLFLEVFGFNSISDLPRPEDFDIMSTP
ncbi:MAG: SMC-Scp complex subunit ScpB [Deltaproteobacteria bacterium]|jgi:segregation and condensation protein B|nr:SMC-Scp complex subunit ScpB [Deltaproteobacteria bacterium]MBT4091523.1 SMC-Scp complex subunit ScpB [Deltaproteobacteria bacterium]MBT4263483.1 SMC-Scp complex subunit ScpB [Deltaproteobacteria bacterium]MBT4639655.1 SMC-Scp complex subunit ScpB [Deltaproteobacteria bacterium]MBT6499621.1 SMC-Scp complex subunit ScpB [Deltaproteobacteria bacterium]